MERRWGATGVAQYYPPRLSPSGRKRIEEELRSDGVDLPNPEPLLGALAKAISRYDSWRGLRTASRPAAVRGNLEAALKAATKLNERLNALDGNSYLLIKEAANADTRLLHDHLIQIVQPLFGALQLAKQYRASSNRRGAGNLLENERLYLAADVFNELEMYVGKNLKRESFHAILKDALEEVQGPRKDLDDITGRLVDRVLSRKVRIERPDGVVEYRRP